MPNTYCGDLRVIPPFDPSLVTAECFLTTTEVDPGDSVGVAATITNGNFFAALVGYEITVKRADSNSEAGERTIESGQIRVGANTTESRSVQYEFGFVGSFDVDITLTASEASS